MAMLQRGRGERRGDSTAGNFLCLLRYNDSIFGIMNVSCERRAVATVAGFNKIGGIR